MNIQDDLTVTWATIRGYFRQSDIDCMKNNGLDLSDCTTVSQNAAMIFDRLSSGSMPPDGKWPQNQIDDFKNWMDAGASCV